MLLLDTDVLIDVQRGYAPALAWFQGLSELPAVPGLVVMELVQDAHDNRQVQQVLKLVAPLPVVWPSESDCRNALAEFTAHHLSQGLGVLDALIGSCAMGLSAELCTFNKKHYRAIKGLVTVQPYAK